MAIRVARIGDEDERVPVSVGEVGLVADPAIDDVATELDALRLELSTSGLDLGDLESDPVRVGAEPTPHASASRTSSVSVPVSNSAPGIRPYRAEHGRPSTSP
jgi:hypothetical protein